jgi:anti-sigma regulatory factor (Ser/Thr protein kinase)
VKYGGDGSVRLEVDADSDRFRVEVIDSGSGFEITERTDGQEGGWGLPLVEHLADRWGTFQGSTHVWFELDLSR